MVMDFSEKCPFHWPAAPRMDRPLRRLILTFTLFFTTLLFLHYNRTSISRHSHRVASPIKPEPVDDAEPDKLNSTLGFGTIIAVSPPNSPRRAGLTWAANLTGLDIVIPEQPEWTDEDVEKFRTPNRKSKVSKGSALAWMGHLNALRWFLTTPHATALILEDDVDFSLHLPSQAALAAHAIRTLITPSHLPFRHLSSPQQNPWAAPHFDLLYLGHCTPQSSPPQSLLQDPLLPYPDPHTPPASRLAAPTAALLTALNLTAAPTRIAHRSTHPLCTFAYAVTRRSARAILRAYGGEGDGGCVAYDVRLLEACRDEGWGCWAVTPEVAHHGWGGSVVGAVDRGEGGTGGEEERLAENIECPARDRRLWVEEGDLEGRAWMRAEVERVGVEACVGDVLRGRR